MNKGFFLFGIFSLLLIVNICLVSADRYAIDRYDITDSYSEDYDYEYYGRSYGWSSGGSAGGSFVRYHDGDDYYWEGSGSSHDSGSGNGRSDNCGDFSSSWSDDVTVTCSSSGCTKTSVYHSSSSCSDDYDDTSTYDINSPVGELWIGMFMPMMYCMYSDSWDSTSTVLSNCRSNDHGTYSVDAYEVWDTGSCSFTQDYTVKSGYCETKLSYPSPIDDYACNFNSNKYEDTLLYGDVQYYVPGKAEDARHNIDTDGDNVKEGCCDTSDENGAEPGFERKYIVDSTIWDTSQNRCVPVLGSAGVVKKKCVDGCQTDTDCDDEDDSNGPEGCCKGSKEDEGTCYTKKHRVGGTDSNPKYEGEKCCADSCDGNICEDYRFLCVDDDDDGRKLECRDACENSCSGKGYDEDGGSDAKEAVGDASSAAWQESISDCRKDENTKYPSWSCGVTESETCCNLFDDYSINSISVIPKNPKKTTICSGGGSASSTKTETGYSSWKDALKAAKVKLEEDINAQASSVSCPDDCHRELIATSSSMDIDRIGGKWDVTVSAGFDVKCYTGGGWIAKVHASVNEKCVKWGWECDNEDCVNR